MKKVKKLMHKSIILLCFIMIFSYFSPLFIDEVSASDSNINGIYGFVDLRTKGCGTNTYYTNAITGKPGYTNGCYGADAAFLGYNSDGSKVKFKISGVTGWVNTSDVEVKKYVDTQNWNDLYTSNYISVNGELKHNIVSNVNEKLNGASISLGPKPSFLANDVNYWSYDGHYFYPATRSGYINMINDYMNGNYNNSINNGNPYYNYYQYLTHRSISNYTPADVANYFRGKGIVSPMNNYPAASGQSLFYGEQTSFVQYQNEFGANIGLSIGVATNESATGTSNIAFYGKNLFGHSAFDSSPGASATSYLSVAQSIYAHDRFYISEGYLDPLDGYGRYYGGHVGDKQSGLNVKYASDPYWGDKAAQFYYLMDNALTMQDYNKYTIAIKENARDVEVYKDSSTNSTILYRTGNTENYPVIVLGETTGSSVNGNNKWYKIQTDPVLNSSRTAMIQDSGYYNYSNNYAYVPAAYFRKVNNGTTVKNRYNITFDANGGMYSDGTNGRKTITAEQNTVPQINPPTKDGDTFAGWSPAVMGATSDTTYVAQWKNQKYNITFNASGGKFSDNTTSKVVVTPSNTKPTMGNPTRDGYIFKGWSPNIENATTETTYTAIWEKNINYYDIIFDANGGKFSDNNTTITKKTEEGKTPEVSVPTRDGYEFKGWSTEVTAATGNKSYLAQWEKVETFSITFDANGGTFQNNDSAKTVTTIKGKLPVVETPTLSGYIFSGWDKEVTEATANTTYKATWKEGNIEDTLTKKDGRFELEYLKEENNKLIIKGFSTIDGIHNNKSTDIKYDLLLEDLNTGKEKKMSLSRISDEKEIPYKTPSNDKLDYTYSWFEGEISLDNISNGDHRLYIIAYTNNYYSKNIVSNQLFSEQVTEMEQNGKYLITRNNYFSKNKDLELIIRSKKLGNKTASPYSNLFGQLEEMKFSNNKLYLYGNSFSEGANLGKNQTVERNIIFENIETYETKKYSLGSIVSGAYTVKLPVSDRLDKTRAWYKNEIDISDLPVGKYAIYISNKSNIEDIGELNEQLFMDYSNVTMTINNKKFKFNVNYAKRYRIELIVEEAK